MSNKENDTFWENMADLADEMTAKGELGWAAHKTNQEFIQEQLKTRDADTIPDWAWLEMISDDGIRAKHTLELLRQECEHGEFENGQCLYCGENHES